MNFPGDRYNADADADADGELKIGNGPMRGFTCDDCYYRWEARGETNDSEEDYEEEENLHLEDVAGDDDETLPACPLCGSTSVSEN